MVTGTVDVQAVASLPVAMGCDAEDVAVWIDDEAMDEDEAMEEATLEA
jgi:hypothetical protein